jgi:hypothetical protein
MRVCDPGRLVLPIFAALRLARAAFRGDGGLRGIVRVDGFGARLGNAAVGVADYIHVLNKILGGAVEARADCWRGVFKLVLVNE